jgi:hypothetical protein
MATITVIATLHGNQGDNAFTFSFTGLIFANLEDV